MCLCYSWKNILSWGNNQPFFLCNPEFDGAVFEGRSLWETGHSFLISDIIISQGEGHWSSRQPKHELFLAIQAAWPVCWSGDKLLNSTLFFSYFFHQVSSEANKCHMSHCGHGFAMSQKPLLAPTLVPGCAICKRCITGCVNTALPWTESSVALYQSLLSYNSRGIYTEKHI